MPLITALEPESWEQLEELVAAILTESGMLARRQVTLDLPRGNVDVDVFAEETVDGIVHRTHLRMQVLEGECSQRDRPRLPHCDAGDRCK